MQRIPFIPASVFSSVKTWQIGGFTAAPIVVGLVRVMDAPNFYDIRDRRLYPINGSWLVSIWRESPHYQGHDARTF
jgi:hypothetical protein